MKRKLAMFLSLNFLILMIFGVCFTSVNASFKLNTHASQGNVLIYVDSTIFNSSIEGSIDQYKTDVENDGYSVKVINWTVSGVVTLKNNLSLEYATNNIKGAVLIGNIDSALYEPDESPIRYGDFPCDLFLMDLDGNWTDTGGLPAYDEHNNDTGDMYPEIFIGRINPSVITGGNVTDSLIKYFERNHQYRIDNISRVDSSLMYIDGGYNLDWEPFSHEWVSDIKYLYSNTTLINETYATSGLTDAADYCNEIVKPYEFIHSFIHSNYTHHGLDWVGYDPGHETFIDYNTIAGLNRKALFYNLYCCHAARYHAMDNLASHYLFSSNYTLAVFGCARSGGFVMNQYLYEPLNNGKSLGEAFKYWWSNDILDPVVHTHGPGDMDVKGNCLLGDPFLRIRSPSDGGGGTTPPIPGFEITFIILGLITALGYALWKKNTKNFINN